MRKFFTIIAAGVLAFSLVACQTDAEVASENLSKAADQFEIARRIVFINGITDSYVFEIQGFCSIQPDMGEAQLEVTCKTDSGYKKHFLGLSDNLTYFVEQLEPIGVSTDRYRVVFKPSTIIPDIEVD
jgi:hypothetical protein